MPTVKRTQPSQPWSLDRSRVSTPRPATTAAPRTATAASPAAPISKTPPTRRCSTARSRYGAIWRLKRAKSTGPPACCIYTNTSDLEFVVDRRPGRPNIVLASACSGHGFKFASAIGEILTDLAMNQPPRFELEMFALARLAAPV